MRILSISVLVALLVPTTGFAESKLTFGAQLVKRTAVFLEQFNFSSYVPDCGEEQTNIDEAIANPYSSCEVFISSSEPLIIPESVRLLVLLEALAIDGPTSVDISPALWKVSSLREIQVANANLESIDPGIGRLHNLDSLDLSGNNLSNLPESFRNLEKLSYLNVKGNPLSAKTIQEIRKWFPKLEVLF
jgi:Leucine-rich repeat (LRR) protein